MRTTIGKFIRTLMVTMMATVALTAGQAQAAGGEQKIVHQVPQMPISIDGVRHNPGKVRAYDGKTLYTVVDSRTQKEGVLRIFTSARKAERYLATSPTLKAPERLSHTINNNRVMVYEDIDYAEYISTTILTYKEGESEEDFTYTCHTIWSVCVNFNDKASSIKNPFHRHLILFEHHWYGGSRLYVNAGQSIPNLVPYGWNDRASSMGW